MKLNFRMFRCFTPRMPFLIGCSLGIALSLILMPFVEEQCLWYTKNYRSSNSVENTHVTVDDYEPVLNVHGKPKKAAVKQGKIQIIRPRYYSTELNIREKLFIGVLSNPITLVTIGSALNRTVLKYADKILFFLEGPHVQNVNIEDPSVVGFTDKRPELVPFYMLKHVAENFIKDYDFFFFTKDTTHIRGRKLIEFVNRISISRNVHVGSKISEDSLYCTLDGGIVLSNNILKKVIEDLDWCIQHAFSDSNSDNIGRCVLHGTNLPCSSKIQGLEFLSHPLTSATHDSLQSSILKSSWTKDLKKAITLYSVSSPEDHYMIHHYFCQQELLDSQHLLFLSEQKILSVRHMLPSNLDNTSWPIGIESSFKPRSRFDVISRVYFNDTHSFLNNELATVTELTGLYKQEIEDIIKSAVHWVTRKGGEKCIFQKLVNGYRRFDATRGTEYILDLVFLEDATGKDVFKRIEALRPLNEVEIIPVPFVTEHSRVILLLIVKENEIEGAEHFLEDYRKACLEKQESTALLLVFISNSVTGSNESAFDGIKEIISTLLIKYRTTGAKVAWMSVKAIGKIPPLFAIIDLVAKKLASDSMILLCQIGMEIHTEYLNRVRMNTIAKTQVFFPIPYYQYHPSLAYKHLTPPNAVEVKKDLGNFDCTSYSQASFYISDYISVRKQFENRVPLIRTDKDLKNEALYNVDFDIYNMFLKSNLHIMRAADPDLRIKFSAELCDSEYTPLAYNRCLENKEKRLASKSELAAAVLSHTEIESNMELDLGL